MRFGVSVAGFWGLGFFAVTGFAVQGFVFWVLWFEVRGLEFGVLG